MSQVHCTNPKYQDHPQLEVFPYTATSQASTLDSHLSPEIYLHHVTNGSTSLSHLHYSFTQSPAVKSDSSRTPLHSLSEQLSSPQQSHKLPPHNPHYGVN
ncbi:unnamed protein product [Pleuronectes platessa]|uniref:Uncharacterized protein n=1 Tax=Pleuronectes platessa TaxID=8262 RepID=A0A9N7US00_PLEPL|nr:unnamed protein product [Pleuronectes platessa]